MAQKLELGMISSAWFDTKISRLDGIRKAKEIGFDTYDIFEDPLDISDDERAEMKAILDEVGLPVRSMVCVGFGVVDFNPSVRRFTLDRIKAYVDQGAYFNARNVLLVVGEYYWDCEVFPKDAIWDLAKDAVHEAGQYAASKGLEIVLELEPFEQALLKDVHELARFVREVDLPAVRANADISHLHLSDASFDDVKELTGLIGHIHLSDCNGEVHGDLPPGHGVTPIKDYLQAIVDTGYVGTVSIELEYSPDPEKIVEWVELAYRETAKIMDEIGVREYRPAAV
jgi:D-psicose/D-tagatose/L-ribulose 3-epimerase